MGRDDEERVVESKPATSTLVDWFAEGESKQVECNGVKVTVRFVGRKGRRGRIVIEAPAGAVFLSFSPVAVAQRVIGIQREDIR